VRQKHIFNLQRKK